MKKTKLTLLCILLVLAITCASIFLVSCNNDDDDEPNGSGEVPSGDIFDPSKLEAIITADDIQEFVYDGNVHNVQATLNHDEATLSYSPSQGYTDVGEYQITISAPATEHYNSVSARVTLIILSETPQMRWDNLLNDLKSAYSIDGNDIKVNIKADATVTPKQGKASKIKLEALGNLDLSNDSNNNTNLHMLFELNDDQYGLYFQQGATYLKLNDDIFSLKNVDLSSLIPSDNASSKAAIDNSIIDSIMYFLPSVLFSDKDDIENIDGVWNLSIDLNKSWSKIKPLLSLFAQDILSEENVAVLDDFFSTNEPTIAFKIDCNTQNALKVEANISAKFGTFKANVSSMEVSNGAYTTVEGALTPAQIAQAKEVNVANIQVQGTLGLVNTLGETYEHLNWKLVVDIDPFALMDAINSSDGISWLNNEQVKKMKVYFSLYHEHQPGTDTVCTDVMCPTRAGGMEDTSILDIAFDPQNFGDSKLYIAANLSRILSEKSLTATLQNLNGLIASMAGQYLTGLLETNFMTAIDLTKTIAPSTGDDGSGSGSDDSSSIDIKKLINPIFELLTQAIAIKDGSLTLDMQQIYAKLDEIFDLNSLVNIDLEGLIVINAGNFKDAVFKGLLSPDDAADTDKAFQSLSLGISSIEYGGASAFNCKNAITHDPVDSSKARKFEGSKPLSLEDAKAKATGKVFNTKQNVIDYTAENGIHATLEEFDATVIGKLIEYTYTAMDGQTYTAYTEILGYEGLDKTKIDVAQTIKAIVLPLDGQGGLFSDLLWDVLKNLGGAALIGGFLPANITLPIKADVIDMTITLTEIKSANFTMTTALTNNYVLTPYNLDENAKTDLSKHLAGTIEIVYTDGYTRTIAASATSDLVDGKYLVNDGEEHTITLYHPNHEDVKQEYKVQAETPTTPSLVITNDGGIFAVTYGPTQNMKIKVILKESTSSTAPVISEDDYRITLGGKTLDELTMNSTEMKRFDLAANSDDIKITFKRNAKKLTTACAYFYLEYEDGTTSAQTRHKQYFTRYIEEAVWGSISGSDLGSNMDGKLTYYYWLDTDDEWAAVRTLTLKFEDGKYYMVDDAGTKVETNIVAYDKADTTKTNILVNGLIPYEALKKLSYDASKKTTKSPSINISATFTFNDKEVTTEKKSVSLTTTANLTYVEFSTKIAAETQFNDLLKFEVAPTTLDEKHEMRLTYKNGKYYFVDTFEGAKIADIEVIVTAKVGSNAIALDNGMIGSDQIGNKVTISVQFTYEGREYNTAILSNKTVIAK